MLVPNVIVANEDSSILFDGLSCVSAGFPSVVLENTKAGIVAVQFSHMYLILSCTKPNTAQILTKRCKGPEYQRSSRTSS